MISLIITSLSTGMVNTYVFLLCSVSPQLGPSWCHACKEIIVCKYYRSKYMYMTEKYYFYFCVSNIIYFPTRNIRIKFWSTYSIPSFMTLQGLSHERASHHVLRYHCRVWTIKYTVRRNIHANMPHHFIRKQGKYSVLKSTVCILYFMKFNCFIF